MAMPDTVAGPSSARRTPLRREMLPQHRAPAVFAPGGGDLSHTKGPRVPVDAGAAATLAR